MLCEHILITNCIVTGYKLGTFLSGEYIGVVCITAKHIHLPTVIATNTTPLGSIP